MDETDKAFTFARLHAHLIKVALGLDPCRDWAARKADKHDPNCDVLASGIAAFIVGHGVTIPPAAPGAKATQSPGGQGPSESFAESMRAATYCELAPSATPTDKKEPTP